MLLSQEAVLAKIKADLNALAIELGFVDDEGRPLYFFHGQVSTYDNYDWIKAIETYNDDNKLKYLPVIPIALIRENSTASTGQTITERLDEYSLFGHIKTEDIANIRELIETYMARKNMDENLVELEGSTVLMNYTNFMISDEELLGAPDGESRHVLHLSFTYDIFESSLASSKDYTLLIDDIPVKYLSWRLEKANMLIANNKNTPTGTMLQNVNKLHEVVIVCELYIDKSNASALKVREDIVSLVKTNTEYKIEIRHEDTPLFVSKVIFNGGKTTDTPPQINTMEVTFALSYDKVGIKIGLIGRVDGDGNQVFEDIPVIAYKFGHAAALYTATYMGDNASKSTVVGAAKGYMVTLPVLTSGSDVMKDIISEVLGKVYTNKYVFEVTYLDLVYLYQVVIHDSAIESTDAAYDVMSVVLVEAK